MELNQLKGRVGEGKVIRELNKLPRDSFFMLNDVLLENNGYYVQIDHILVSKVGIYLIETKNWTGDLYGDHYSEKWKLYNSYGKLTKVHNPAKQAWTHKRGILSLLEKENTVVPVHSILVFLENVNLKKVYADIPILQIDELLDYILNQDNINTENVLTFEEMKDLYDKFNVLNILDEERRIQHISNINSMNKNNSGFDLQSKSVRRDYLGHQSQAKVNVSNNHTWQNPKNEPVRNRIYLFRRLIASILDVISITVPFILIGLMGTVSTDATILIYGLLGIIAILVVQCFLLSKGKSIGKKLLKIKVVSANTYKDVGFLRMLAREFIGKFMISSLTYGLVYILPLFTKRNRGIHDFIFKTIVVEDK